MSVNGKFQGIAQGDLLAVAERYGIGSAPRALREVGEAVGAWPEFAGLVGAKQSQIDGIAR
jgi:hypothetical protein